MKERHNTYYDSITPESSDAEFLEGVLRKAENMDTNNKKRTSKRPVLIACAAALTLCVGVTAAAATGLINFRNLFGDRITTQDEQLADDILVNVEDFEWRTSDDNYRVELKGVTGSESDMLFMCEIVRTDGKPVTDFMTNIPKDGNLKGLVNTEFSDEDAFRESSGYISHTVNDSGNIEVYSYITTNGILAGQHYSLEGINFYPLQLLSDFSDENEVYLSSVRDPMGFYSWVGSEPQLSDIAVNDERVIGLELDWSISFTYTPSEVALTEKSLADDTQVSINSQHSVSHITEECTLEITYSSFSCVGGRIEGINYNSRYDINSFEKCNQVYLLMDDGSQIPCTMAIDSIGYYEDGKTEFNMQIQYSNTRDGIITAIDITKVTAISINGTEYALD